MTRQESFDKCNADKEKLSWRNRWRVAGVETWLLRLDQAVQDKLPIDPRLLASVKRHLVNFNSHNYEWKVRSLEALVKIIRRDYKASEREGEIPIEEDHESVPVASTGGGDAEGCAEPTASGA